MASNSQQNPRIPAVIKGHRHFGYGGAVIPENIPIQQHYNITTLKKSNVRLNDQLIPKPTDINMAERMIKVAIPKEHPYSSHISRLALFPSYHSPDDPDSGVRAASQRLRHPLIPSAAPEVTVVSKTMGAPYRLEVLEAPMASKEKAVEWTGDRGYLDQTKPVRGESQRFYPSPQKIVFPNPKLRDWDITLPERTANMLKNVERSHWLTSYQLHYTGSGPANPLNMDDFKEKITDRASGGLTSHSAQLREMSHPVFVPSKPREGRKAMKHTRRPASELTREAAEPNPASASTQGPGTWEATAWRDETQDPHPNLDGILVQNHKQAEFGSSHRDPPIIPRPPVLPGISPAVGGEGAAPGHRVTSLRELQDSFSKTDVQRRFCSSVAAATVDLRDNTCTGRRHNFHGFNGNVLHG